MSRVRRAVFCLAAAGLTIAEPCAAAPPSLASVRRWACFYGKIISEEAWKKLELAVVDPDEFAVPAGSGALRVAYVSVGEADERRSFWNAASSASFVIENNPDWTGAHRVDLRSTQWRALLLGRVIPDALAKGYQGVFLDTLDTAEYLESKDPKRFAGSVTAASDLVLAVRERFPDALILVNNGLPLLGRIGRAIDGIVVEDLYTRCDPAAVACGPTPKDVSRSKEDVLRRFARETGKPVLALLYADIKSWDSRPVRAAARRAKRNGFRPYLSTPALMRLGVIDP